MLFAWAFDWNWLKPAVRHYVRTHANRAIEFDDLRVHVDRHLDPTVEFRNLTIQNAPWAAPRPLIHAGRFVMTFEWRSLWADRKVIRLMVLEDADVDLERHADGLRNWRLADPEDRGPPKILVLALDARRSVLHTVQGEFDLIADARMTALPQARAVAGHPELPLTKRLSLEGTVRGQTFAADTAVSDVLVVGDTPGQTALDGTARLGDATLAAHGLVSNLSTLGALDVDATLRDTAVAAASPSSAVSAASAASPAWPLPAALLRAGALMAHAHVTKAGSTWTALDLHATLGRHTEFAGDLGFTGGAGAGANTGASASAGSNAGTGIGAATGAGERRSLHARLHDGVVDFDDLRALSGSPAAAAKTAGHDAATSRRDGTAEEPGLSARPFDTTRLRDFDADIDIADARFLGSPAGLGHDLLQRLRLKATLRDGVLQVPSVDVGVAGGHVAGTLRLDAAHRPAELALDLRARGVRVERLAPTLAKNGGLVGALDGHATLRAAGDSPRALASTTAGTLEATLAPGASVSKRLDAKLSLDGGEWLRSLLGGGDRVAVRCAALSLAVAQGIGTTRGLAFETGNTLLTGQARVDLARTSLDATLTPHRKQSALLALDKSVRVTGPVHDLHVSLVAPPTDPAAPANCVVPRR